MTYFSSVLQYAFVLREFVAPSYKPERYYMRGPGPACAKRTGVIIDRHAAFN